MLYNVHYLNISLAPYVQRIKFISQIVYNGSSIVDCNSMLYFQSCPRWCLNGSRFPQRKTRWWREVSRWRCTSTNCTTIRVLFFILINSNKSCVAWYYVCVDTIRTLLWLTTLNCRYLLFLHALHINTSKPINFVCRTTVLFSFRIFSIFDGFHTQNTAICLSCLFFFLFCINFVWSSTSPAVRIQAEYPTIVHFLPFLPPSNVWLCILFLLWAK